MIQLTIQFRWLTLRSIIRLSSLVSWFTLPWGPSWIKRLQFTTDTRIWDTCTMVVTFWPIRLLQWRWLNHLTISLLAWRMTYSPSRCLSHPLRLCSHGVVKLYRPWYKLVIHLSLVACFLHHLRPAALSHVNRLETCTSVCNLYIHNILFSPFNVTDYWGEPERAPHKWYSITLIICIYVTGFAKRDHFDKFFKTEFSSHLSATRIALKLIVTKLELIK